LTSIPETNRAENLASPQYPVKPLQTLPIVEETSTVMRYNATCQCGRTFRHRDRKTLESNIDRHLIRFHGANAEYRQKLEYVKKELGQIRKRMNRRWGC